MRRVSSWSPASDVGVASVNTMQQIGCAIGTALLSTVAATAASSYLTSHTASTGSAAAAAGAAHGYSLAFNVAGCVFVAGAIVAAVLFTAAAGKHESHVA